MSMTLSVWCLIPQLPWILRGTVELSATFFSSLLYCRMTPGFSIWRLSLLSGEAEGLDFRTTELLPTNKNASIIFPFVMRSPRILFACKQQALSRASHCTAHPRLLVGLQSQCLQIASLHYHRKLWVVGLMCCPLLLQPHLLCLPVFLLHVLQLLILTSHWLCLQRDINGTFCL